MFKINLGKVLRKFETMCEMKKKRISDCPINVKTKMSNKENLLEKSDQPEGRQIHVGYRSRYNSPRLDNKSTSTKQGFPLNE